MKDIVRQTRQAFETGSSTGRKSRAMMITALAATMFMLTGCCDLRKERQVEKDEKGQETAVVASEKETKGKGNATIAKGKTSKGCRDNFNTDEPFLLDVETFSDPPVPYYLQRDPYNEASDAPEEDNIYAVVEQMPEFPGGLRKMTEWLDKNKRYPAKARAEGIAGRVIVGVVVEKDGRLANIRVLKGIHPLLDNEAIRLVKAMPRWNAGKQNGIYVRVKYAIPVSFGNNSTGCNHMLKAVDELKELGEVKGDRRR